jgi:hypothetical protein
MPFFSPMAARMTVGRVANEGVTTERAILQDEDGARELGEFKSWRAVRADRRLATTGAQNHDPDTSPCAWQTCFLLSK